MSIVRPSSVRSILFASALALGCASSSPEAEPPPGPREDRAAPSPSVVPRDGCVCGTEPGCPPCPAPSASSASAAGPDKPPVETRGTFPPKDIAPPEERTKKPGDGAWAPLTVHRSKGADSPLYTTVLHPHKVRGDVVVQLVAIDLSRVSMDLVLGTDEPEGVSFPKEKKPGLVGPSAFDDLIAVTNGGFKKRHGGHGVGVMGETAVKPSPQFCTYAKTKGGKYLVGTYEKIAPDLADGFEWFRQTPPCLVENGVKNPDTMNESKARRWGRAEDGKSEIRRSAVGFATDDRILYFAIGDWVTPAWLSDALVAAGLQRAAELDINWSYTRFIVYERAGTELVATSPLLTELKAPKREYVKEPSQRDFFTLRWKAK